jgi:hypothetical protein
MSAGARVATRPVHGVHAMLLIGCNSVKSPPRRIEGTIGGGGQPLTLSTVNCSVHLLKIP